MVDANGTVVRLKRRKALKVPDTLESAEILALPGPIRLLTEALERAKRGEIAGVTIIGYAADWSWTTSTAGPVLRFPAVGLAAAHMMASDFERRIRTGAQDGDRRV